MYLTCSLLLLPSNPWPYIHLASRHTNSTLLHTSLSTHIHTYAFARNNLILSLSHYLILISVFLMILSSLLLIWLSYYNCSFAILFFLVHVHSTCFILHYYHYHPHFGLFDLVVHFLKLIYLFLTYYYSTTVFIIIIFYHSIQ